MVGQLLLNVMTALSIGYMLGRISAFKQFIAILEKRMKR